MPARIFYSMYISDMKRGEHAVVLKVERSDGVGERLRALGVYVGAKIVLLKTSVFRRTFLVQAGSGKVALGRELASEVRVWKT